MNVSRRQPPAKHGRTRVYSWSRAIIDRDRNPNLGVEEKGGKLVAVLGLAANHVREKRTVDLETVEPYGAYKNTTPFVI
jgi:hypothetical protein